MKTGDFVKIKDSYFLNNSKLKEFLLNKSENRIYLGLIVRLSDELNCFVPLRSNLPNNIRVQELGVFRVPSNTKPDACLDLTKTLLINQSEFLEVLSKNEVWIPLVQKKKIEKNLRELERLVQNYIKGYCKEYKHRIRRPEKKIDPLYQYSTLQNYHNILGLELQQ